MGLMSLIPQSVVNNFITDDKIASVADELLGEAPNGSQMIAMLKKEKDGKYYIHVCELKYTASKWTIAAIKKTDKFTDLIKNVLKWTNKK